MMINILCICADPNDTTSFYRAGGPFSAIRQKNRKFNFIFKNEVHWLDIKMADIVFMERPYESTFASIAQMVKDHQRPLWIDYDDALTKIPASNSSFTYYQDHRSINKIMDIADIITVSAIKIKDIHYEYKDKIKVIPNALDDSFIDLKIPPNPENKVITWRGSNTHEMDVLSEIRHIQPMITKNTDTKFYFMGCIPACIEILNTDNISLIPKLNMESYQRKLIELRPKTHIVPLARSEFNDSKSNIAWIEATLAGANVLASPVAEFKLPGIGSFDFPNKASNTESWEYIMGNLRLSKINKIREEIIEQLLG